MAYDDLVRCGSVAAARDKGLYRMEGKEYVVDDGDVMLFKFNVCQWLRDAVQTDHVGGRILLQSDCSKATWRSDGGCRRATVGRSGRAVATQRRPVSIFEGR